MTTMTRYSVSTEERATIFWLGNETCAEVNKVSSNGAIDSGATHQSRSVYAIIYKLLEDEKKMHWPGLPLMYWRTRVAACRW